MTIFFILNFRNHDRINLLIIKIQYAKLLVFVVVVVVVIVVVRL